MPILSVYSFRYGDYVQAGLVGAQDAGEPFFAYGNRLGYDHYSFYLLLRKMGRLKTLAVGRYKVNFGQGLIINNSFGFGKLAMLSTLGRQATGITHIPLVRLLTICRERLQRWK